MPGGSERMHDNDIQELTITAGQMTLGRGPDNTHTFSCDSVSTHHARITTLFNASYIEDLGSTNGTYINGKRIHKHTLHNGDTLLLGELMIRIIKPDMTSAA